MLKSYKLRIFPNKNKAEKIDALLNFWKEEVQKKIDEFWPLEEIPAEYKIKGRLPRDAYIKACQIVKGAKKAKSEKPIFKGNEIDLNSSTIKFLDLQNSFDFWIKVSHLEKNHRLALPGKRFGKFNDAIEKGKLKNSAKLL